MALSAAEKASIGAQITDVLESEIHGQFMELYGAAVAATERQPEQVNNEIRNAMTHFARAVAAADMAEAMKNVSQAKGHIERAKRDAVKIAVVALRNRIDDLCADFKRLTGTVEQGFLVRRDTVASKRREILKEETKGSPDVMSDFVALFLETDALHTDMTREFARLGGTLPRWRYVAHSVRRNMGALVIGLIIGVGGSMAFAILAPDSADFGHKARRFLRIERAPTMPRAPNIPSTPAKPGGTAVRSSP